MRQFAGVYNSEIELQTGDYIACPGICLQNYFVYSRLNWIITLHFECFCLGIMHYGTLDYFRDDWDVGESGGAGGGRDGELRVGDGVSGVS